MEELLNKLIEKGWKPFGWELVEAKTEPVSGKFYFKNKHNAISSIDLDYRQIASKESGLWQFCTENMLINKKWFYGDEYCIAEHCEYTPRYYKFRLIKSALCDEDKLEDFILSNIKVEGEA